MSNLSKLDERLMKEAEDATPTWKIDPYAGLIKKEKLDFSTNDEITEYIENITSQFTQNGDIDKLPFIGINDTLKKQLDNKYQVDTLKKLDLIDNMIINIENKNDN